MSKNNRQVLEEMFSEAESVFETMAPIYFKELDKNGWTKKYRVDERLPNGFFKGRKTGVYEYFYKGEIIYVGQSQCKKGGIRGRTHAFKRNIREGLTNPSHKYNEKHAEKWVNIMKESYDEIYVRYCPCHYRLSKKYEDWRLKKFIKKNKTSPMLNVQKV